MNETNIPTSSPSTPPPHPGASAESPKKKKSAMPWVIAGLGCLSLIVITIVVVAVVIYNVAKESMPVAYEVAGTDDAPLSYEVTAPASAPPAESAPAGWRTYSSSIDTIPSGLQEHFVEFSFNYPEKFSVVPDEANFIKVEENLMDATEGSFTLENFAVGYMTAAAGLAPEMDQEVIFPMLIEQLSSQFAQGFPNYQEISQSSETVAGLPGRVMLFQSEFPGTARGDVKIYGKIMMTRQPGKERGVVIIMLASSLDPAIKGPADVGTTGDLAPILSSFRLGPL